jgi:aarF domain-containing kinase
MTLSSVLRKYIKSFENILDFQEARNMKDFASFLSSSRISGVVCPYVFEEASSRKILTMSRLYGKPLTDLEAIRTYTRDPEGTLLLALNTWMMR